MKFQVRLTGFDIAIILLIILLVCGVSCLVAIFIQRYLTIGVKTAGILLQSGYCDNYQTILFL